MPNCTAVLINQQKIQTSASTNIWWVAEEFWEERSPSQDFYISSEPSEKDCFKGDLKTKYNYSFSLCCNSNKSPLKHWNTQGWQWLHFLSAKTAHLKDMTNTTRGCGGMLQVPPLGSRGKAPGSYGYLAFQTMPDLQILQSFCAPNMLFHCCVSYKILLFLRNFFFHFAFSMLVC